jgi:predicted O-methyltransferase YrrM
MQKFHFYNFILFCLNYKKMDVIIKKILKRINIFKTKVSQKDIIDKLDNKKTSLENFMIKENFQLYKEAKKFSRSLEIKSSKKLKKIEYDLGGGGAYNLIYFITRQIKPEIVLETGVAAGYSSYAFLEAMNKNKIGKLFSSDFPYFRIPNPVKYIGILVDKKYKKNWELFLDGDERNVIKIKKKLKKKIDLIHYDSDKTYEGKKNFFNSINSLLRKNTIIIIDDIQDDNFFLEYIANKKNYKIFKFKKKYLGLIY